MTWLSLSGIAYCARFFLVILFPFSALDKIINYTEALAQARSSFLPGGKFLLMAAIGVETLAPISILLAWHDRLAACVLAGFCAVTAFLYHPFWTFPDFWARGESKARNHFWDFLKNFGLVGGLLLIILLKDLAPASFFVNEPLSSTPTSAEM